MMDYRTRNHALDVLSYENSVKENEQKFFEYIEKTLNEIDFMRSFFLWDKEKKKNNEQIYYDTEKRMLAYLIFGSNRKKKDKIVEFFLIVYDSLIQNLINWYNTSEYKSSSNYSSNEIRTIIKSYVIETINVYKRKFKEVRIPFGTFLKKRVYIHLRGELQDILRKTVLYEKWKSYLYHSNSTKKQQYDEEHLTIRKYFSILKDFFLYENQVLTEEKFGNIQFFHNLVFVNKYVLRKNIDFTKFIPQQQFKEIVSEIENDLKILKRKLNEDRNL